MKKSRQYEYQLECHAKGLCIQCGKLPAYKSWRCEKHYLQFAERNRKAYQRKIAEKQKGAGI